MEEPSQSHHLFQEAGDYERAFMIGSIGQLYDQIFKTLRTFLFEIHYTHEPDEVPTDLPLTDYQVYVASTDSIISADQDRVQHHKT